MQSIYAFFDGEKFVPEKEFLFKKGQKVILTVLEEDNFDDALEETTMMYCTANENGSFDYLFQEGEQEYSVNDCKKKYK